MPQPGSQRSIVMEMEIQSGNRVYTIPVNELVQAVEVESSTRAAYSGTITLFDKTDKLENLLLVNGLQRSVRFRWNWLDLGLSSAPQYVGSIIRLTPTFMPQGIQFVLEFVPTALLRSVVNQRPRSFRAGMLISDIVRQIADENSWVTTDARGNATIESTATSIDQPFNSRDESDVRFINRCLKEQAVNAAGVGGYRFYFDTFGAVHFHTKNWLPPQEKVYLFGRDTAGEVITFTPSDTSALAMMAGGGNVTYRGQSSLNATETATDGTTDTGLEDEPEVVEETAIAVPDFGTDALASFSFVARDEGELERLAKSAREKAKELFFLAEMQVVGTHGLELLDFAHVQYIRQNGQPHYMSGRFRILKIAQSYSSSGWQTTFMLSREGLKPQTTGTVSRQNVVTISPQEIDE